MKFLLRVDCKSAKEILQKDVQNLVSKQNFARWQAILFVFGFEIELIKGSSNVLHDFLSREFLQGKGVKPIPLNLHLKSLMLCQKFSLKPQTFLKS